jgi:hypothetical protein
LQTSAAASEGLAMKMIGLLQEIAAVVWTLTAAWIALPGGIPLTAGVGAGLAVGAVAIVVLALVRRGRSLPARSPVTG